MKFMIFGFILLLTFFLGLIVGHKHFFPFGYIKAGYELVFPKKSQAKRKERSILFDHFTPKSDIVMIGDSLTQSAIWSEIFPSVSIANRGVNGDSVEHILSRLDTIYSVNPCKAFLMVGVNNFKGGDRVEYVYEKYVELIHMLRSEDIKVVIQSTVETSINNGKNLLFDIRKLNELLKEYSKSYNLVYINLNKKLATHNHGLLEKYTYDGVHLNALGYVEWSKMIKSHIYKTDCEL